MAGKVATPSISGYVISVTPTGEGNGLGQVVGVLTFD